MRPRSVLYISALSVLLIGRTMGAQSGALPEPQATPQQLTDAAVRALPIKAFKLLKANTGWVSTGTQLLSTTDDGGRWKEISPPNPNRDEYASVFFRDEETGWVLIPHSVNSEDWTFTISLTVDGGASWSSVSLPEWKYDREKGERGLADQGTVTFADRQHGWLSLGIEGNTLFASSILLSTSDGGRTWHDVPRCKSTTDGGPDGRIEAIVALTDKDLWVIGSPEGGSALYVSHDSGSCFQAVSLSAPKEIAPAEYATYSAPEFDSNLNGYEAVSYRGPNGSKSAAVLFETGDGGRTWKSDRMLSNLAGGETVATNVVGASWVLAFAPHGAQTNLVRLQPNDRITATTHESSGDFNRCSLDFSSQDEGWINCSGKLSSTVDGGESWTAITPRTRSGVLTQDPETPSPSTPVKTRITRVPGMAKSKRASIVPFDATPSIPYESGTDQYLGFDRDYVLSTDEMATWWAASPYYDVGIYLPGSPSGPNTSNPANAGPPLDPDWVETVVGQGWGIIPVWSGLQAPCACHPTTQNPSQTYPGCNTFKHTFSAVSTDAFQDGKKQAAKAYAAATALGLDGSIIYVDVENYDSAQCGTATQSYLGGWIAKMHESALGGPGSAGVYGALYDASDIQAADDGFVTRADKRVTVWGLNHNSGSTLTDGLTWTNKQRIHQYQIDKSETWGDTTPYKIDNDIVDATVVPGFGIKEISAIGYSMATDGTAGSWLSGIANGANNSGIQTGNSVGTYFSSDTSLYPEYYPYDYPSGGFTYLGGAATSTFSFTGSYETYPNAINNRGEIVGSYELVYDAYGDVSTHGFYAPSSTGALRTIDFPGAPWTELTGINDAGWIVGSYIDGSNISHCALWKPPYSTPPVSFDAPNVPGNGFDEECNGINGLGQIVGWAESSDGSQFPGFLDDAESADPGITTNFSTVPQLDSVTITPMAVNNNGAIDGYFCDPTSSAYVGFLVNSSEFISVPSPDGNYLYLYGLNDDVQLVGNDSGDSSVGIIMSAAPNLP